MVLKLLLHLDDEITADTGAARGRRVRIALGRTILLVARLAIRSIVIEDIMVVVVVVVIVFIWVDGGRGQFLR